MFSYKFLSLLGISFFPSYMYLNKVTSKTEVISGTDNEKYLSEIKKFKYIVPICLPSCISQMIMNEFFHGFKNTDRIQYKREELLTNDGGVIGLDYHIKTMNIIPKRVILIMHGLTGGANSSYIKDIVEGFEDDPDTRVICINFRGINNTPLKTFQTYHAGLTLDIEEAVLYIKSQFPKEDLYLIGTSMGANIISKYLSGESLHQLPSIKAFISISNPLNISHLQKENMGGILDKFLLYKWKKYLKNHYHILKNDTRIDIDLLLSHRIYKYKDFDKEYTCKVFNFKDVSEYYRHSECKDSLENIMIPSLFIHSTDDFLSPIYSIDTTIFKRKPNFSLVLTNRGGHCCWFEYSNKKKEKIEFDRWFVKVVVSFVYNVDRIDGMNGRE